MRVAIDQAGQHCHLGKIDDLRPGWNGKVFPYSFNLVVADENDLIVPYSTGFRVNQPASFDRSHLRRAAQGTRQPQPQQECESSLHGLTS